MSISIDEIILSLIEYITDSDINIFGCFFIVIAGHHHYKWKWELINTFILLLFLKNNNGIKAAITAIMEVMFGVYSIELLEGSDNYTNSFLIF